MICFDLSEFKQLYKEDCEKDIRIVVAKFGFNHFDLHNDKEKLNKIADYVVKKRLKNKENIEIFAAISSIITFFNNDGKICFVLKNNFNIKKEYIKNIDDLKMAIEEKTLTDFAIWNNGLRQFQLKQYRFKLETNLFFEFIKKILRGYGNDLGDVNLLIILQGSAGGKIYPDEKIYNGAEYILEKIGAKKFHALIIKDFISTLELS